MSRLVNLVLVSGFSVKNVKIKIKQVVRFNLVKNAENEEKTEKICQFCLCSAVLK